ncbi:MAG TPA: dihydrodipicolinate synthase family protein [Chthoniobacteraceae bacterium]|jgi:N-acetylneuraminate lyase|nr:dihydrodipicolinate synthase family protein [Chthoniobacteraceae bacterium]
MPLLELPKLHGLVTATHTPFHADGSLNLAVVERQAELMLRWEVGAVFVGGTTGESHSLTVDERRALAQRWSEVVRGTKLRLVVHVGANCVEDARALAAQAEQLGVTAIAAVAPCYFKPRDLDTLIATMAPIAAAAPATPFYYYDIPSMTGLSHSMPDFLESAPARIPTLAGLKFTNPDLMAYQYLLRAGGGKWDVPFGVDEHFLGALAMGARGAVGSGFNFAAPIYQRLMKAFAAGDLAAAREEQFRGVQLIKLFVRHGYMGAAKATMQMLGVDVGPARLPNASLDAEQAKQLRGELEGLGYFEWIL